MKESNFGYNHSLTSIGVGASYDSENSSLSKLLPTSTLSTELIKFPPKSTVLDLIRTDYQGLKVYPNPASYMLSVETRGIQEKIKCFDQLGREVHIPEISRTDESASFNTSSLIPGIYWLRIGNQTQKIVIQR